MRTLFSALCLLLLWCTPLHAETLASVKQLEQAPRIKAYITSRSAQDVLFRLARAQDEKWGLQTACKDQFALHDVRVELLSPVEMPENATAPTKGAWMYHYFLTRCGEDKRYNAVVAINQKTGKLLFQPYFPGETKANLLLVRQAVPAAVSTASAAVGAAPGCRQVEIIDMRVTEQPDSAGIKPWKEVWTCLVCGKKSDVELTFTPAPDHKNTAFAVKPLTGQAAKP